MCLHRIRNRPARLVFDSREARAVEAYALLLAALRRGAPDRVRALSCGLSTLGYGVEPLGDVGLRLVVRRSAR